MTTVKNVLTSCHSGRKCFSLFPEKKVKNIATQGFYSRAFVKSDKWWDEKVGIYVFKNISSYVSSFIGERCFFPPNVM